MKNEKNNQKSGLQIKKITLKTAETLENRLAPGGVTLPMPTTNPQHPQ